MLEKAAIFDAQSLELCFQALYVSGHGLCFRLPAFKHRALCKSGLGSRFRYRSELSVKNSSLWRGWHCRTSAVANVASTHPLRLAAVLQPGSGRAAATVVEGTSQRRAGSGGRAPVLVCVFQNELSRLAGAARARSGMSASGGATRNRLARSQHLQSPWGRWRRSTPQRLSRARQHNLWAWTACQAAVLPGRALPASMLKHL
mmetsp:Transcript_29078/g.52057  ORF Transcript_29078/g.52057 Transcript_29078/m.52057 type:complete len:202 (-) Transcript_29078:109-714(-)